MLTFRELLWQLNGLFNIDFVHGILESKDFQSINIVFSFNCVFVNKATGYAKGGEQMKVNNLYSELLVKIYASHCRGWGKFDELMLSLRELVKLLKGRTVCLFQEHYETGLFTVKFHLLDKLRKGLKRFRRNIPRCICV